MHTPSERDYQGKALDIAIRLAVIALIVFASIRIFTPFLVAVVWGAIIAIALGPAFTKLKRRLGGRNRLTGAVFLVVTLAALLVPTVLLTDSLLDGTIRIVHKARDGTLDIPLPTERVKNWPIIGERAYAIWEGAHVDLKGTMDKLQPQLGRLGEKIVSSVTSLAGTLLQTVLALIMAAVLLMTSEGIDRVMRSIAIRMAGHDGPDIVSLAVETIRSVVKGVILVALIQGILAAAGLAIAGVPATGLWALLVVIVAVIQLPPILILGPIIPWVFANNDSTAIAVFYTIWTVLVSVSDSFLKPVFLGRGVRVPMLVILVGAIGGMLQSGVVGLFIGPVVLAIAHELLMAWIHEGVPGKPVPPDAART